jgi:hypothetical protein
MTTMWKVVYGSPAPVEVQAQVPCWPNMDAAGDKIFDNTHFIDLEKAWERHLAEHRAGVSLSVSRLKEARAELARRESELCEASVFYEEALRAHDEFKGSK